MIKAHNNGQRGQVGLVVLLVGAVLMTVGLGVASQSVMEINTANLETDSSQVFNAAEQGIEMALQNPADPYPEVTIDGYTVGVVSSPVTDTYQGTVLAGHSAQLDMTGVTNLSVTWLDENCSDKHAAIVVTYIGSYGVARYAYGRECGNGDGFIRPASPVCGATSCTVSVAPPANTYISRIKSVYGGTQLSVGLVGSSLPIQSYEITSTATKTDSGETRSVQVNKSIASVPSIFDYVLFSGGDLVW